MNLAIDDSPIEEARRIGQHNTKKEAVTTARSEYIAHRKRLKTLANKPRAGATNAAAGASRDRESIS